MASQKTVYIQFQDTSGNWMTIQTLIDDDERRVKQTLDSVQSMMKRRVRAITQGGSIIDIRS